MQYKPGPAPFDPLLGLKFGNDKVITEASVNKETTIDEKGFGDTMGIVAGVITIGGGEPWAPTFSFDSGRPILAWTKTEDGIISSASVLGPSTWTQSK